MSSWTQVPRANPLVADKDRAETFAEANLSLSHSRTAVAGEALQLADTRDGTTAGTGFDSSATWSSESGVTFEPNVPLAGVIGHVSGDTAGTFDRVRLRDVDDGGTELDSWTGSWTAGDSIQVTHDLAAGRRYAITGDRDDGDSWSKAAWTSTGDPTWPQTSDDIDNLTGWHNGGTHSDFGTFGSVEAVPYSLSGTAVVEWPMPPDVYAWDVAQFQAAPDGEAVQVFIEENDGGWTEVAGPVPRGEKIPGSADNNVRYRVELSRADPANSPTLDAIYRRWKL